MDSSKYGIPVAALAGMTLLIGGAGSAQADTTGDSDSFNIGPSSADINSSSNVALDKFNSALGTLTGVKFTLQSETGTFASVEASCEESCESTSADVTTNSSFQVELSNPAIGLLFGPLADEASASCTGGVSCSESGSESSSLGGDFNVLPGDVGLFAGIGTFDVEFHFLATLNENCGFNSICDNRGSITWSGNITVEYTYDPAVAVPEPGALALAGMGLVGLAAARRRRAK